MQQTTSRYATFFSSLSPLLIFLFTCALSLLSPAGYAQDGYDSGTPIIDLHSRASVLYQDVNLPNSEHVLALSKYKKRDNRWRPDKVFNVTGSLSRYTLELPKHYSAEEIFAFYVQQLPSATQVLFRCEGRACGESNNWANDHFQIKQLYGLNENQYYGVFAFTHANVKHYATIYSVRRGNRRLYVQLDIISSS